MPPVYNPNYMSLFPDPYRTPGPPLSLTMRATSVPPTYGAAYDNAPPESPIVRGRAMPLRNPSMFGTSVTPTYGAAYDTTPPENPIVRGRGETPPFADPSTIVPNMRQTAYEYPGTTSTSTVSQTAPPLPGPTQTNTFPPPPPTSSQFGGPGQAFDPAHTPYPYNEPYTLMGNTGFTSGAEGSLLNNWITQYNSPNNQDPNSGIWGRNPLVDQLTQMYGGILPGANDYNSFINASAGGIGRSISDLYSTIANNMAFGNASGGNINSGVQGALGLFNQGTRPSRDWASALFSNNLNPGDPGVGIVRSNYGLPGTNLGYKQMNQNYGAGQQQQQFGTGQQGRASNLYDAIATGGVPLNRELFDLGRTAFNTLGRNVLPSERVGAGTAGVPAPAAALGQQANRLFGGPGQTVGQPDFFRDLLTRAMGAGAGITAPTIGALPGVTPPAGYRSGIGLQEQLSSLLSGQLGGAGLTPEYVEAARRRFLDPQMEALKGRLNQQGGGQAGLDSPLFQELARREERDFMDRLLIEGGDRLGAQQAQAQSLGGQQQAQDFALRGTDIAAQQFNAAQEAERQRANQGAALATQSLGVNAGLTGLGLGGQLSQQEIARQQANQGAGLQASQIGAGMLGQQADIEARLAQFNPALALQAALANQGNTFQTGREDAGNAFRQADLARAIAGDYTGLAERTAAGQGALGQAAIGNALNFGGANTNLFNALSGQNLNAVNTANQFGQQPGRFQLDAMNPMLANQGQLFDFANQLMGAQRGAVDPQMQLQQQLFGLLQGNQAMGNQFLQQQQGYQAGQQGMGADLLRQSLGGDYDIARQLIAALTAKDVQSSSNTGSFLNNLITILGGRLGK